jgi:hypothetical protein
MIDKKKLLERLEAGQEYRSIAISNIELRTEGENDLIVEGYATTFEQPYELYNLGDYIVQEQIARNAFDGCDISDVIFQYDHNGRVMARTRNKTLELATDNHGLKIRAHLGGTELGRQLYEEIKGGYTDRMSFRFKVGKNRREVIEEDHEKNVTTVLRTIESITKLYDVSAVSIPANEATDISARSAADGAIEGLREQERLQAEKRQKAEKLQGEIRQLLAGAKSRK